MSKDLKNIKDSVMDKINNGQVKMKPKVFFVIGSLLTFIGLVSSIITSVFLIAITRFFMRAHGPMGAVRLDQLTSNFPWWAPVIAVISLLIGIKLLRYYDFSYKKNFAFIVFVFVLAVFVTGWVFDMTGLNDIWLQRGPMRGMMRQYFQTNNGQFDKGERL
ncbi:MAG: hypothetical protein WCO84_02810 [bacterium]